MSIAPLETTVPEKTTIKTILKTKLGPKWKWKNTQTNRGHETFPKDPQRQRTFLPSEDTVYVNVKMCTLHWYNAIYPTLDLFWDKHSWEHCTRAENDQKTKLQTAGGRGLVALITSTRLIFWWFGIHSHSQQTQCQQRPTRRSCGSRPLVLMGWWTGGGVKIQI